MDEAAIGTVGVSEHTKERIWQEMWDITRYIYYYEDQANSLATLTRAMRGALLVGAAGSVLPVVLDVVPAWGALFGALGILVVTVIDFVWDWGSRAALAHAIGLECRVIEKDYDDLWVKANIGQIGEEECQARVNQLCMRVIAASSLLAQTDRKLNDRSEKAAVKILKDKWSVPFDNPQRTTSPA